MTDNTNSWWEPSDEKFGFHPKFNVTCVFCQTAMTPRLSLLVLEKKGDNGKPASTTFEIKYKCKNCEWLAEFVIESTVDYWSKILKLRNNRLLYYPLDLWDEDEQIKKKLKSLGYF